MAGGLRGRPRRNADLLLHDLELVLAGGLRGRPRRNAAFRPAEGTASLGRKLGHRDRRVLANATGLSFARVALCQGQRSGPLGRWVPLEGGPARPVDDVVLPPRTLCAGRRLLRALSPRGTSRDAAGTRHRGRKRGGLLLASGARRDLRQWRAVVRPASVMRQAKAPIAGIAEEVAVGEGVLAVAATLALRVAPGALVIVPNARTSGVAVERALGAEVARPARAIPIGRTRLATARVAFHFGRWAGEGRGRVALCAEPVRETARSRAPSHVRVRKGRRAERELRALA